MSDRFLNALHGRNEGRPPVWLMRQAGRYMPQYRVLRAQHSLWEMFHDPEIAAQVTLLPIEHLGVDAAILFSDILVIAEALGLEIAFPEQGGPRVLPVIRTPEQVDALILGNVEERLGYVSETLKRVRERIEVPLIGFCGGPFTVATYMIDAKSHAEFAHTRRWMQTDPDSFNRLLSRITEATEAYLRLQVKAGAQVIQIFDSWANILSDAEFQDFCMPHLKRLIEALRGRVPVILFCRGSSLRPELLSKLEPACISYDWHHPMHVLRELTPAHIAVQGNLDPELLKRSPAEFLPIVRALLKSMQGEKGFIFNLGHGVLPDTPFEHVQQLIEVVKNAT